MFSHAWNPSTINPTSSSSNHICRPPAIFELVQASLSLSLVICKLFRLFLGPPFNSKLFRPFSSSTDHIQASLPSSSHLRELPTHSSSSNHLRAPLPIFMLLWRLLSSINHFRACPTIFEQAYCVFFSFSLLFFTFELLQPSSNKIIVSFSHSVCSSSTCSSCSTWTEHCKSNVNVRRSNEEGMAINFICQRMMAR